LHLKLFSIMVYFMVLSIIFSVVSLELFSPLFLPRSGGVPTNGIEMLDNFDDTPGVTLSDHVMDIGNGWSVDAAWDIEPNGRDAERTGGGSSGVVTDGLNNGVLTGRCNWSASFGNFFEIEFRRLDDDNKWDLRFIGNASLNANRFSLRKHIAGVITIVDEKLHDPFIPDEFFRTFEIILNGPSIEIEILDDGPDPPNYFLSANDNFNSTRSQLGMFASAGANEFLQMVRL